MRRPGYSAQPHRSAKSGNQQPAGVIETPRTYHFEIAHDASTPPCSSQATARKKNAHPHHAKFFKIHQVLSFLIFKKMDTWIVYGNFTEQS